MSARMHALRTQVRLTLAQARADRGRLIASTLAVAIGSAFVVVAMGLTASSDRAVLDAVAGQYADAAAVVAAPERDPDALVAAADRVAAPGRPVAVDRGGLVDVSPVGAPDGSSRELSMISVTPPGPLRWERVLSGRLPERDGEVAVSGPAGLGIGDTVQARAVLLGNVDSAAQAARVPQTLRVVGTLDVGSDLGRGDGPLLYATPAQADGLGAAVGQVRVGMPEGRSAPTTLADVRRVLAASAVTRTLAVTSGEDTARSVARNYSGGTAGVTAGLLVFVVLALLVSGLVIANTFAVVLAQRVRELALLRCVGASARQVALGLLGEALLVGMLASVAGAALGAGLTVAIALGLADTSTQIPLGTAVVPVHALVLAVVAGTLTCVVAALVPARTATRVEPLAALHPLPVAGAQTRRGRVRLVVAGVLAGTSLLVMLTAARAVDLGVAVGAGVVSFAALVVLLQAGAAPLAGTLGRVLAPLGGVPATLAGAGVRRHPRRTASATLALLVGITLTAAVLVGAASTRATAADELGSTYPIDVVVRTGETALPDDFVAALKAVAGVRAQTSVTSATVRLDGLEVDALGIDLTSSEQVTRTTGEGLRLPHPGEVVMPFQLADRLAVTDGKEVTVLGKRAGTPLRVVIARTGQGPTSVLMDRATLGSLGPSRTSQAWVRLDDGLDDRKSQQTLADLARLSTAAAPGSQVTANVATRRGLDAILDTLLVLVTTLLGVSVLIALIGLANTLALSAVERRRESAVLRALGTTRGQLGATVVWEAVLVAAVAAGLGVLLGVGYGLVGTRAGLGALHVVVPWGQLLVLLVGATGAGVLASLLPAWRTTRGAVVAGLAEDR